MILVLGQVRTGTSLCMQMLHAAGANCGGEYPAFECDDFIAPPYPFDSMRRYDANKVIWRTPTNIPDNALCIVTTRDPEEQIRSEWKMLHTWAFENPVVPAMDRYTRRKYRADFAKKEKSLRYSMIGKPHIVVPFEDAIRRPLVVAQNIIDFIGIGDQESVAGVVRNRKCGCYPGFLELLIAAEEGNQPKRGN